MDTLKEKKNILTLRLKNNIQNEDWKKLIPAIPLAEEFKVSPQLLKIAWILAGEYSRRIGPVRSFSLIKPG